jgi:hypothetical protein
MKTRLIVALALVLLALPMTGAVAQNDTLVMRSMATFHVQPLLDGPRSLSPFRSSGIQFEMTATPASRSLA